MVREVGFMRVLVIGAGQMGAGIAQVLAAKGHEVLLNDVDEARIRRGIDGIAKRLDRDVEKGKLSAEQRGEILTHIDPRPHFRDLDIHLAIEAATERLDLKLELFRDLDRNTPPEAIIASNTSSISITTLGAATAKPDRVIGMHFMNPVPVMKLVEIIRGIATSDATYAHVRDLALGLDKTPVEVRDFPGFISNRVLLPMINEAVYALYEGVASVEAIDTVMKLGMNHPMGPLALADFIGLDTCLAIMNVLYDGFGDSKYRPCPLLKQFVAAGWYGKKSGRGFYDYTAALPVPAAAPNGAYAPASAAR
ncbi:3-hydroxybutyryl-CoA dehydrogenase [Vulcanimicrobium alpinum]|uniref:3-hydroxybutyryl-CoA dehydrogenase n=2 Tax=Vulcanimicrobium alpinum TaxID=3016050 RepID=A0AAN2CBD6_UNVUL|nr:3-hydroxybutyryl-CoA dehydrogenase [Vulcanimicrobium alpinum]BDE07632.1 3-hydroxybutyryl-CoA dehydrogenase [Vulcanimicrobium alpinum]